MTVWAIITIISIVIQSGLLLNVVVIKMGCDRLVWFQSSRTGSSSEETESSESDSESTTSFEEGSYDGQQGDITYQCRDDEAIAQGLPGAKMYDQNIRETYVFTSYHYLLLLTVGQPQDH